MGPSGAGKSTLLNSLTFRNLKGLEVTGKRFLNGKEVGPSRLRPISAYIQQDDLFIGTLTPREHLTFQARVRIGDKVPLGERAEMVEKVMKDLGLDKCGDTVIGIPGRIKGVSGGEKKRLSFATEILTDPIMLFLDEPTSGLDAYMAQNVVEILHAMTRRGKSVLATIHQPSSQVFNLFDKVILMAEGKVVFTGSKERAFEFFNRYEVTHFNEEHSEQFPSSQPWISLSLDLQSIRPLYQRDWHQSDGSRG